MSDSVHLYVTSSCLSHYEVSAAGVKALRGQGRFLLGSNVSQSGSCHVLDDGRLS